MGEAEIIDRVDTARIRSGADAIAPRDVLSYAPYLLSHYVGRALGAKGMVLTLPAACAAGNYAIGFAADLIRAGRADVVVTGASEMMQSVQYAGFARLGAIAPDRCQPFDLHRKGLLLGEGAGVLVLESEAHAVRRGATALAEVGGYGLACDAYHITRPHPDGYGNARAMREAIARSGLTPADVDFVNAHGTGTSANDSVEAKVVREVFGPRSPALTSVKSMIGHCMGASSALEAVTCVETILTGIYPPTMNYETPDPECDVAVVANESRRGAADVVLNNALAFGGYDAVLCFARPGRLPAPEDRA
jgi:3-oxoacyl-[acyl-carrier-protein] synthase II